MEFKEDTSVYSADGKEIGRIDRVVIDPNTKEVTHVVVRKGLLFVEDKVLPVDLFASSSEDRATLKENATDLQDFPNFEEQYYINAQEEEVPSEAVPGYYPGPLYWYPPYGYPPMAFPGYIAPPYVVETQRNIPEGTIPLKEGAEVISSDDQHAGNVEEILTEPDSERITHLVISKGLLLKKEKLVPSTWISNVEENRVYLAVGSGLLEKLPEYGVDRNK